MALNYVWIGLILIGMIVTIIRSIIFHDATLYSQLLTAIFDSSKLSFEICLGLAGVMAFWMGVMNIGNNAGLIQKFSKLISPLLRVIFPSVPAGNPAFGSMSMNFAANMLGLDNAATPLGLEAIKDLQNINETPDRASDAQITFMAFNNAGLTIIPTSVIALRQTMALEQGLKNFNGADVFIPTLIVSFSAFLASLLVIAYTQKINIFKRNLMLLLVAIISIFAGMFYMMKGHNPEQLGNITAAIGSTIILVIICMFIFFGFRKKIDVYSSFIDGAKGGFNLVISIAPYLVAMLFAIAVFRTSGAMQFVLDGVKSLFVALGTDTRFVDALPVAFMKPLSGGGARGLLVDIMKTHGVDSFPAKLASIMQGGTETTFYVLAVYFGSVNIKNTRNALWVCLLADLAAVIVAIAVGYYFFG